jgi:hypothetical protein
VSPARPWHPDAVPWCEDCSRFLNPNTLQADGSCPTCGTKVAKPTSEAGVETVDQKVPWHFKLLIAVTVIYLGFRFIQLALRFVEWLT